MKIDELIIQKYGNEIHSASFDKTKQQMMSFTDSKPIKRHLSKDKSQSIVRKINKTIGGLIDERIIEDHDWAFDLPAWVGPFTHGKIMLIGEEPHIENHNYQLTYDIDVVALEKDKSNRTSKTWTFWNRLLVLTGDGDDPVDHSEWTKFFERFYVTDLCHFAPKGKQNLVRKIENWGEIRAAVAQEFLKKEIAIVRPEIILSHGRAAAKQVSRALNPGRKLFPLPSLEWLDNNIPHLNVWHLGSNQTGPCWKNRSREAIELYKQAVLK